MFKIGKVWIFSKKMNEYMLEKPVHLLLTWVLGDASCTVLQDVF